MFSFLGAGSGAPECISLVVNFSDGDGSETIKFSRRLYRYCEVLCVQADDSDDDADEPEVFLPHVIDREVFERLRTFLHEWDELPNKFVPWADASKKCATFGSGVELIGALPPRIAQIVCDQKNRLLSPFDEEDDVRQLLDMMHTRSAQRSFDARRRRILAAREAYAAAGGRLRDGSAGGGRSMAEDVTIPGVPYTARPPTVLARLVVHADFLGITPLISLLAHVVAVGIRDHSLSDADVRMLLGEHVESEAPLIPPGGE
jgi:hypothetical protein